MKLSNFQTPRTLSECVFTTDSAAVYRVRKSERVAGYVLAVVIGVAFAGVLFVGLSK